jgi:hypothetical protein
MLAAMIVNHFKMRSNVMTYNLSGMGCSAGVISLGLAQQLLQVCMHALARRRTNHRCLTTALQQHRLLPCLHACMARVTARGNPAFSQRRTCPCFQHTHC